MNYRAEDFEGTFNTQRHILGFVVASCIAAFVACAVLAIQLVAPREGAIGSLFVLVLTYPFTIMLFASAAALLGLPASFLLARLKLESSLTYGLLGLLLGIMTASFFSNQRDHIPDTFQFFCAFGGLPGAAWGLVWWFTARRMHRD